MMRIHYKQQILYYRMLGEIDVQCIYMYMCIKYIKGFLACINIWHEVDSIHLFRSLYICV